MEWLTHLSSTPEHKINFKKLDKFTLYDQNYISEIDEEAQTFKCVLNCKRINRIYSTICQIEGDLKIGMIDISCRLLDQQHIIHGQWQYQRIELARFAFRYNERSYRNIYIRTNPLSGEVAVTLSFMTGSSIVEDDQKFREIITDLCHIVGEESEMIFNTMLEIIFGREANEPYLKSAIKLNPGFPRYMKVEKLLDKIKSLITTSSFYKIRSNISEAHKNRSSFKKIYLNQDKKFTSNHKITQLALAYEIKFNKKYQEVERKSKQRFTPYIKDYIQLEEKNEVEFAKHLNERMEEQFQLPALHSSTIQDVRFDEGQQIYFLVYSSSVTIQATAKVYTPEEYEHQKNILKAIGMKHPNMSLYFIPENPQNEIANWVFFQYEEEIPLRQYLNKNRKTISLSTKLHIMSQVCSVIQYLHKKKIGFFIHIDNIYITRGLEIKVRQFKKAYMSQWADNKNENDPQKTTNFILKKNQYKTFPYIFLNSQKDLQSEKCDILSVGICLYLILMDKFPFIEKQVQFERNQISVQSWKSQWIVQTQYYLSKGGQIVKIIAHLLLKCLDIAHIPNRPYVEWLLVILSQIRTSLNGLY